MSAVPPVRSSCSAVIESGEVPVGVSEGANRRAPSRRRSSLLGLVVASILALTACGPTTLWTWGGNSSGAVGDSTVYDQEVAPSRENRHRHQLDHRHRRRLRTRVAIRAGRHLVGLGQQLLRPAR